jgi:hypothetical protein
MGRRKIMISKMSIFLQEGEKTNNENAQSVQNKCQGTSKIKSKNKAQKSCP